MSWVAGRQGGGYFKWKIFQVWSVDCYLLKYPEGTGVKYHKDPVSGKRHYRINVLIKRPEKGGEFRIRGASIVNLPFLKVFRPDLCSHAVEVVEKGERLILSLGLAL